MDIDPPFSEHSDEDYINIEVSSYSNPLFQTSPSHSREFEFQMSFNSQEKDLTTSPADELFYKGKLLPLNLPPRLQMVEKLLRNSKNSIFATRNEDTFLEEEFYSTPLMTTPTTSTPFQSCDISPSESCQISRELNPDEYTAELSIQMRKFNPENPKKSWTKKFKQSSLGFLKFKSSRAYIKTLFTKSSCSNESCEIAYKIEDEGSVSKAMNKYVNVAKKKPFGEIPSGRHRRSFSVIVKQNSGTKSSSSSSSTLFMSSSFFGSNNSSGGFNDMKRCGSAHYSEVESSIQGAIAHCKQSQSDKRFVISSRRTVSEIGFHSLSATRVAG